MARYGRLINGRVHSRTRRARVYIRYGHAVSVCRLASITQSNDVKLREIYGEYGRECDPGVHCRPVLHPICIVSYELLALWIRASRIPINKNLERQA